jgi:pimeloyl-ACP methyl ester carboxylesterase
VVVNPDAPRIDLHATPVGYQQLHADRGMEFQCNRLLQWVGEVRQAAARIDSFEDWVAVFLDVADKARAVERRYEAAYYDRAAEFFMPTGDIRRAAARARFVTTMRQIYQLNPVQVPFKGAALPTYDVEPNARGDASTRATIVIVGGFDEYAEEIFPMVAAAADAGYRVVAFDGPGQGGALEDGGLPMTPAWEEPLAAILDHFGLSDVTLIGISLGGGLVIRAAAFEPRVRRVVSLDVLDDFLECLGRQAGPGATPVLRLLLACRARRLVNLIARGAAKRKPLAEWGLRQGMHVTGTKDAYGFFQTARLLNTHKISAQVTADVLLLAGADDHYVPVRQLRRQAQALTNARSVTTRMFTSADQAGNHCQIGNLGACIDEILAWIEAPMG